MIVYVMTNIMKNAILKFSISICNFCVDVDEERNYGYHLFLNMLTDLALIWSMLSYKLNNQWHLGTVSGSELICPPSYEWAIFIWPLLYILTANS